LKNTRLTLALFAAVVSATFLIPTLSRAQIQASTSVLLTIEGKVEVTTAAAPAWKPAQTN